MITPHAAKKQANVHLRAEGSHLVADHACRDKVQGVWVVGSRDPDHPEEMLIEGGLVVTDEGEVHSIGSTPDAVDVLMQSLRRHSFGSTDNVWSREGESLELSAEESPEEGAGLAALAASQHPWPGVLNDELEKPYFRDLMRFID